MARVLADDANYVFALYDAAAFAKSFYGCSYFHGIGVGETWWSNLGDKKTPWGRLHPSAIKSCLLLLPEGNLPFGQVVGAHF